ncbi:hypothetical protein ENBRE01_1744 [Enteropsectra breve]|nr:hypothetical protein ENBRE01_1744 [Enteropsectra breve]
MSDLAASCNILLQKKSLTFKEPCMRHGPPAIILSDQGKEFTSKTIKHFCNIIGTKKSYTSAYNPKRNGAVEKLNRTLVGRLAKLCKNDF